MGFFKNIISKIKANKPKRQERRKNRRIKRQTKRQNKMRLRKLTPDEQERIKGGLIKAFNIGNEYLKYKQQGANPQLIVKPQKQAYKQKENFLDKKINLGIAQPTVKQLLIGATVSAVSGIAVKKLLTKNK